MRTRKQLLDAAAAMLADRAGIGKGTVFRHFATKEDLIAAIVGDLLDDLVAAARARQDVVLLMTGVHQAAAPLRDTEPDLWRRYLGVLFDGLLDATSARPGRT
ncbi:TetR family transcriptional regulator [Actinophytocola algeriensis]|uniref:AcrR family transcriptional regulator n=1 Tax=Actinophytocola algeriensis TaxID=1768010 RepID=A0A7W7VFW0_9PSEU|nr:TetR family transcriptional regulator [Actinophytocola algeriensis]MBB4908504.1 AcrR family transcriptional regulator [Actinophytocola algeriensis]MBE1475109.1 AcrR family transcriptional regulator [Actinophytocola algeriensis]